MISQYKTGVSPYKLETGQKEAWERCYVPLKNALKKCGERYKNLFLVFEYTLPGRISKKEVTKLVWPDVLIVSKEKILVLEFKNKPLPADASEKYMNQAEKYKHRLEKYHLESAKRQIDCVLVSTQMKKTRKRVDNGVFCSSDYLDLIIQEAFPKATKAFNYNVWIESGFIGIE